MRPGDRTIRDELRREAANVSIPEDMWQNISRRLDEDTNPTGERNRLLLRGEKWRPAALLVVAAGFFWFALIPALPRTGSEGAPDTPSVVVPAGQHESDDLVTQVRHGDPDGNLVHRVSMAVKRPPHLGLARPQ